MSDPSDWVLDGHAVHVEWDSDEVKISHVSCPFDGVAGSICKKGRDFCVVSRYLGVYGFELNVGRIAVNSPVEIAWIGVLGGSDLDDELASIWVCPVEDEEFKKSMEDSGGEGIIPPSEDGEL